MCLIDNKRFRISLFPVKCYKYFKIDQNGNLRNYFRNDLIKSRILFPRITFKNGIKEDNIQEVYDDNFVKVYEFNGGFIHAMQQPPIYPVILTLECVIPPLVRYAVGKTGDICSRIMIITDSKFKNYVFNK